MKAKALALFSGGLDSTLSARIVSDQGIQVEAVHFVNAFLSNSEVSLQKRQTAQLGIKLHILDISQPHLEMVQNPRYGYGNNMNPCIDCRILMLREAKAYMQSRKFHFLISGEVLGQRPMSQRRDTLNVIDRDAGVKGLVLRPLSAKLLTPAFAEEKGWVDRDKLFSFSGRTRKPQIALAKELGIKEYLTPAGGCLLTEAEFTRKFKDLISSGKTGLEDVRLLKIGRHFRMDSYAKIVVGRDEEENRHLEALAEDKDLFFTMRDFVGPLTLTRPNGSKNLSAEELAKLIEKAARLTARYGKGKDRKQAWVDYCSRGLTKKESILVSPAGDGLIKRMRI